MPRMKVVLSVVLFSVLLSLAPSSLQAAQGVVVREENGRVRVEVNGALFTEYFYHDVPRPYCYPLIGPGSLPMTRSWPMENKEGEEHDHKHHRSFWFAHGLVNGQDLWSEEPKSGRTRHEGFVRLASGTRAGIIESTNTWIAGDGKPLCGDVRKLTVYATAPERVFDFEITLYASQGDVTFGDTKEGTMALRLAESMRLTHKGNKPGKGRIVTSEGVLDGKTWGTRADWVDYHGPVDNQEVGAAIFDHPKNLRHPTWWHVRDYGLFAANPFGIHDFEKKPAGTGDFLLAAGRSVTFRYRFVLHEGDEKAGRIAEQYKRFAADEGPLGAP
jgi:hypothetical protein